MKTPYKKPLTVVVPKARRLFVYKQALYILKNNIHCYGLPSNKGLCLLLPCVLWNLNHYLDNDPNGDFWLYTRTVITFPEIADKIKLVKQSSDPNQTRINILTKIIKEWMT